MNNKQTKQDRFESLLDNYAVALHLTYQIMDSGLLEKKIKLGNDTEKITNFVREFLPRIANEMRIGERMKDRIKTIYNAHGSLGYFASAEDIAEAYFYELRVYGSEWAHADLEDLFTEYSIQAKEEAEKDRERW